MLIAVSKMRVEQRRGSHELQAQAVANVKKKGATVTEVSAQERARMRDKVKPIIDKYTEEIGEDLVKAFYSEIDKVSSK